MPTYEVTDTREVQTLTTSGKRKTVYRVWLTTAKGASGELDVSLDKWNKDDLPALLEAKATSLDLAFNIAPANIPF